MSYTEEFAEGHKLLSVNFYSGVTTEQNTTFVSLQNYHRVAILIWASNVTTTLDADVEVSTTGLADSSLHTLKSITQLTSGDDAARVAIEIQSEELSKPTGAPSVEYDYLRVETTPSGSGTYMVAVIGISPRYKPVGVNEWDEVVD